MIQLWRDEAECAGAPPEIFFPEKEGEGPVGANSKAYYKAAREYCNACPVKAQCLEWALGNERYGMFGGMTPKEREALKRRTGRTAAWTRDPTRTIDDDARLARYNAGMTDTEIGEIEGYSRQSVASWRKRRALRVNLGGKVPSNDTLMELHARGLSNREIGRRFGVSDTTIGIHLGTLGLGTRQVS